MMKPMQIFLIIFFIQLLTIDYSDSKSGNKVRNKYKPSMKEVSKTTSSKITKVIGEVANTITKPKVSKSFRGLERHKAITMGAAAAGGAALLPFLMRKKFKRRRRIPAIIGPDRHYYRHGIHCYSCEGKGSDECVNNPETYARRDTCISGQYCSVLRREIVVNTSNDAPPPNQSDEPVLFEELDAVDKEFGSSNNETIDVSFENKNFNTSFTNLTNGFLPRIVQIFLSRGCYSPESIFDKTVQLGHGENFTIKLNSQTCLTDFCNTGDGRLKCYECEGEGLSHPCMNNPSVIAKKVTCQANEYCNILRLTTMAYLPMNDTSVTKVTILRGCREDEDYEEQGGISLQSFSCSSNYCNGVDWNHLTNYNTGAGLQATFVFKLRSALFAILLTYSFCDSYLWL